MVAKFVHLVASGEPVQIEGDGETSRDFTYVANVVDANVLAADAEGVNGRVLNVAAGASHTVNELADTIGELLERPVEKRYGPARPGDIRASWADISEARRLLGYEPHVGFEEGLRRTADFLLQSTEVGASRQDFRR